ncbi:MAG TPA: S26 family signal peptidase [Tepidisphaeraceae bacterium]
MPGTLACGRCATSLVLATATIDVHPPRAGKWRKRLRRINPVVAHGSNLRAAAAALAAERAMIASSVPAPALLGRLVLPGWPQLYLGERWQGHLMLWVFVTLAGIGLLRFGTMTGSLLLGAAFSVHSMSACDITNRVRPGRGVAGQVAVSVATSILLALLVYLPAGYLLTSVASPRTIVNALPPLERGDVMLVNHWSGAGRGKIALYELPQYGPLIPVREGGRYRVFGGDQVDRVLAIAGDRVTWRGGALLVNGAAPAAGPLAAVEFAGDIDFVVPPERVFIVPSTMVGADAQRDAAWWRHMCTVPETNIRGRVWARNAPIGRAWLF